MDRIRSSSTDSKSSATSSATSLSSSSRATGRRRRTAESVALDIRFISKGERLIFVLEMSRSTRRYLLALAASVSAMAGLSMSTLVDVVQRAVR